jgi:hypothetical protein
VSTALPNYYELLGVSRDSSADDIKAAYRRLTKTAHPDVGGTDGMFVLVGEAFHVLSDPVRRLDYDRELDTGVPSSPPPDPTPPPSPPDPTPPPRQARAPQPPPPEPEWEQVPYDSSVPGPAHQPPETPLPAEEDDVRINWVQAGIHLALVAGFVLVWCGLRATGVLSSFMGGAHNTVAQWLEDEVWSKFSFVLAVLLAVAAMAAEWFYGTFLTLREIEHPVARWTTIAFIGSAVLIGEYIWPVNLRAVLVIVSATVAAAVAAFLLARRLPSRQ